jgi:hypothetical protein
MTPVASVRQAALLMLVRDIPQAYVAWAIINHALRAFGLF